MVDLRCDRQLPTLPDYSVLGRLKRAWHALMADPRAPVIVQFGPRIFDLRTIGPEHIDEATMIRALVYQPRWNGATRRHYSVAEHSLAVMSRVSDKNRLWALLHDASEALMGDLITPIKRGDAHFRELEGLVMRAVCERYGLPPAMPGEVHEADMREQAREARDVLPFPPAWRTAAPYDDRIRPIGVGPAFELVEGCFTEALRSLAC